MSKITQIVWGGEAQTVVILFQGTAVYLFITSFTDGSQYDTAMVVSVQCENIQAITTNMFIPMRKRKCVRSICWDVNAN